MDKGHKLANMQDEIDLAELTHAMWQSKWFIFFSTVLTLCVGLIYILVHKPIYEAKVILIAPIASDLAAANYGRNAVTRLKPIPSLDVFNLLRAALFAQSTLEDFYSSEAQRLNVSSRKSLPTISCRAESFGYAVVASAQSSELAATALQRYLDLTQKITLDKLNESLNKEISAVKLRMKEELHAMRMEPNKRTAQLLHLQDALQLAEKLGIDTPGKAAVTQRDTSNAAYLRGSIALKMEIASLKKQIQPDDLVVQQSIIKLQDEYDALSRVHLNENDVSLIRADGKIVASNKPIPLNVQRIMGLSALFGLLLGVLYVTLRHIRQRIRIS